MHHKRKYADVVWHAYTASGTTKSHQGLSDLVDGGYHRWLCTICPFKEITDEKQLRWSRWLEAMRKDVECFFGILKGRWRILALGIRFHDSKVIDDVWFTCLALHNMLLEIDGLAKDWDDGVVGFYDGPEDAETPLDGIELDYGDRIPAIFLRLGLPQAQRHCIGARNPEGPIETSPGFDALRAVMVMHCVGTSDQIEWPRRNGKAQ